MTARTSLPTLLAVASLASLACGGEGGVARDEQPGRVGPNTAVTPVEETPWEPEVAAGSDTPVGVNGHLRIEGPDLVNESGAVVQLKGISTMWLNWEQRYSASKEGLRWLRDNWDLSVIRAAMGVERDGGYLQNPAAMVSRVRTIVHNAVELGVYVIIDWHDHNAQQHPEAALEFFRSMADEFGEYPGVLYETFNEPVGNVSWPDVVKPYHEQVTAAIRERDPDNVIIMGTPFWSQAANVAADDPVAGENLMYTVHFYSCDHRGGQRQQAQAARQAGAAIFVTEWGATKADGGTDAGGQICVDEARIWHQFLNDNDISWAAWKLDDCTDLSCLLQPSAPSDGGWTDEWLYGHGPFVRDRMLGLPL